MFGYRSSPRAPWRPILQQTAQCHAWFLSYLHTLAESIPRIVVVDYSEDSYDAPITSGHDKLILFELHDGQELAVPVSVSERPTLNLKVCDPLTYPLLLLLRDSKRILPI